MKLTPNSVIWCQRTKLVFAARSCCRLTADFSVRDVNSGFFSVRPRSGWHRLLAFTARGRWFLCLFTLAGISSWPAGKKGISCGYNTSTGAHVTGFGARSLRLPKLSVITVLSQYRVDLGMSQQGSNEVSCQKVITDVSVWFLWLISVFIYRL